ncbi:MAG: Ig-like domain-containing protein [Clostridia bacterium]|nr:Ig-like domain-containing protein [Clostridia bacterium]
MKKIVDTTNVELSGVSAGKHTYVVLPKSAKSGEQIVGQYSGKRSVTVLEDWRLAPTITKIEQTGAGKVKLTWSVVSPANYYSVYEVIDGQNVMQKIVDTTSAELSGVSMGRHTYVVLPKSAKSGEQIVGQYSNEKSITVVEWVIHVEYVQLDYTSLSMAVGDAITLHATVYPLNATDRDVTWSSNNTSVATVSAGKVTAKASGQATITVTTVDGHKTASCTVTVSNPVEYRALLIGEESFSWESSLCTRNRSDVTLMERMLNTVRGTNGKKFSITKKYDLNRSGVLSAIKNTFASADNNDISLFFIASHGNATSSGSSAGALSMSPSGDLTIRDLTNALNAVPGKVIVILESCGSGAAVYGNGSAAGGSGKELAKAFDEAVIKAFSEADPGIVEFVGEPGQIISKTGEMRISNKFYVLTASAYLELSYGWEGETSNNFFTKWLTDGIGTSGNMPADTNTNGQTTLHELYSYISRVGDDYPVFTSSGVGYQHVQVYPANSSFVLFCR